MSNLPDNSTSKRDKSCNTFCKEGHRGENLCRVSSEFFSKHSIPRNAFICHRCRNESYENSTNSSNDLIDSIHF